MAITKVLIAVKTYPALSSKYDELVCTAGFREDGSWIRIYPIQFRKKSYSEQYKKYDWVEVDLVKNESDFRPESYRPHAIDSEIKIVSHVDTARNWLVRKQLCLGKVYYNLSELISEAKNKVLRTSLAVFQPSKILDFIAEPTEREWDRERVISLNQLNLFEKVHDGKPEVVKKLPYKFRYVLQDNQGTTSRMMIEDWEIGQLYWNCLRHHKGNEQKAVNDVRRKYFDDFAKTKDLHLFLGTSLLHHDVSRNPFMIIGTFHPKIERQTSLF